MAISYSAFLQYASITDWLSSQHAALELYCWTVECKSDLMYVEHLPSWEILAFDTKIGHDLASSHNVHSKPSVRTLSWRRPQTLKSTYLVDNRNQFWRYASRTKAPWSLPNHLLFTFWLKLRFDWNFSTAANEEFIVISSPIVPDHFTCIHLLHKFFKCQSWMYFTLRRGESQSLPADYEPQLEATTAFVANCF